MKARLGQELQEKLPERVQKDSRVVMMGYVSALREVVFAEGQDDFTGSREDYEKLADLLDQLSNSTGNCEFDNAYAEVARTVRAYAASLSD